MNVWDCRMVWAVRMGRMVEGTSGTVDMAGTVGVVGMGGPVL